MPKHMLLLRILCDANVPLAEDAFGHYGPVRLLPGRAITKAELADVDVLVVRSVTPVDADLLDGTPVRFVGSATAGTDHVNTADLARLGVAFASAPGSNAASVVEYVLACLLALASDRGESLEGKGLGIVGVGQVGSRLAARAEALGMTVSRCDPLRAAAEGADGLATPSPSGFVSLERLLVDSDIVSIHTPLTDSGESPWPTRGLLDDSSIRRMLPGAWLLNAARGPVVDGEAAMAARQSSRLGGGLGLGALVLDCWPGEPAPSLGLVAAADLATPHVAGYSFDGKVAGTALVAEALRRYVASTGAAVPAPWDPALVDPAPLVAAAPPPPADTPQARTAFLDALARQAYDVRADDARFRAAVGAEPDPERRAAAFAELRKTYPRRRENAAFAVAGHVPEALRRAVAEGLGMRLSR